MFKRRTGSSADSLDKRVTSNSSEPDYFWRAVVQRETETAQTIAQAKIGWLPVPTRAVRYLLWIFSATMILMPLCQLDKGQPGWVQPVQTITLGVTLVYSFYGIANSSTKVSKVFVDTVTYRIHWVSVALLLTVINIPLVVLFRESNDAASRGGACIAIALLFTQSRALVSTVPLTRGRRSRPVRRRFVTATHLLTIGACFLAAIEVIRAGRPANDAPWKLFLAGLLLASIASTVRRRRKVYSLVLDDVLKILAELSVQGRAPSGGSGELVRLALSLERSMGLGVDTPWVALKAPFETKEYRLLLTGCILTLANPLHRLDAEYFVDNEDDDRLRNLSHLTLLRITMAELTRVSVLLQPRADSVQ